MTNPNVIVAGKSLPVAAVAVGDGTGVMLSFLPSETPGFGISGEFDDISTTVKTVSLPSGALFFSAAYGQNGDSGAGASAAGGYVSIVFNAASDADAAAKLATPGARRRLQLGFSLEASFPTPGERLTRVDIVAPESESGKTLFDWTAVVS